MRRKSARGREQPGPVCGPEFGGSPRPRSDIGQAFQLTEDRLKRTPTAPSLSKVENNGLSGSLPCGCDQRAAPLSPVREKGHR
jgi:hypothetical protein